jgi:hypothetical protein
LATSAGLQTTSSTTDFCGICGLLLATLNEATRSNRATKFHCNVCLHVHVYFFVRIKNASNSEHSFSKQQLLLLLAHHAIHRQSKRRRNRN